MNKKILTAAMAAALAVTAVVGGSLAYFTDTQKKDNTFTVGNVKIELTEPNWESTGAIDAPDVYPGESLAKDPTVKNIGDNPCFVRIKVDGLDSLGEDNLITYRTNYQDNQLSEGWKLYDGYIYYTTVLLAGETTETPAFTQIHIPETVTNGFDGNYDVVVTAEAVQAQGADVSWANVQNMTVEEIAAWFGTCGMNDTTAGE